MVEPGERLGRYQLQRQVGKGGMGVVYLAHDPELDRNVALKVLRTRVGDAPMDTNAEARLVREAQAMAAVTHPCILPVYDVGLSDHGPYIAMEYVEGQTLRRWLGDSRTPAQILAVFRDAGRGLAAAHAAGLVHRDFKPTNVMIGDDGRVRVMDFGLARAADSVAGDEATGPASKSGPSLPPSGSTSGPGLVSESAARSDDASEPGSASAGGSGPESGPTRVLSPIAVRLTDGSVVMGTPAFMAPEQHRGRSEDARSDQFAFCVGLYWALVGHYPFKGGSLRELARAKRRGGATWPAQDAVVPLYVREAVLRGLSPQPSDRWPSMDALVGALSAPRRRSRAAWIAGVALVGAGAAAWQTWSTTTTDRCSGGAAIAARAWSDTTRASVEQALLATDLPYSASTAHAVLAGLDDYTTAWVKQRRLQCERIVDSAVLDRAIGCFDRRLAAFRATVDLLAEADAALVERAVSLVYALTAPECDGAEGLAPPEDPTVAAAVADVRAKLATASTMDRAGRFEDARPLAENAAQLAAQLDYPPVVAEAGLELGQIYESAAQYEEARDALSDAYHLAVELGHHEVAFDAARTLMLVVGDRLSDKHGGQRWARHATAALERLGDDIDGRAILAHTLGVFHSQHGDYAAAERAHAEAFALSEADPEADAVRKARTRGSLANALAEAGKYDEAIPNHERVLELLTDRLGPDHPEVGDAHNNLALTLRAKGDAQAALDHLKLAEAIYIASYGESDRSIELVTNNIGTALGELGREQEAVEYYRRSLELRRKTLDPSHPGIAKVSNNLGTTLVGLGRRQEAIEAFERALVGWEQAFGPDHPDVAMALNNLGRCLGEVGRLDEAVRRLERAIAIRRGGLGPDHPLLASALRNLAEVRREQGQGQVAEALDREAAAIENRTAVPPRGDEP